MECGECKGKHPCSRKFCPFNFNFKVVDSEDFSGSAPPQIFVGSKLKYPNVNVGIISPPEFSDQAWVYNDQIYWADNSYSIRDILNLRSHLINSKFTTQVKRTDRFLNTAQEVGLSNKPVDLEFSLKKKPSLKLDKDKVVSPLNLGVPLKKVRVIENVKIS